MCLILAKKFSRFLKFSIKKIELFRCKTKKMYFSCHYLLLLPIYMTHILVMPIEGFHQSKYSTPSGSIFF